MNLISKYLRCSKISNFWQDKIKAFLHDPPDKALILFHKSHEAKRDEILKNLHLNYDNRLDTADHLASAMQRLHIPENYRMNNARNCIEHICFKGTNFPVFKHTLSGKERRFEEIKSFINEHNYKQALEKYCFNPEDIKDFLEDGSWKKTYLKIWRYLPEKYNLGYFLPADTRVPDHSIWDHLDITTAISASLGKDKGLGLFAVKIPAVQEFISQSRKLSDLWASSHIFSTIIFEGMKTIIDKFGPDSIIYPHLRGNSFVDDYFDFGENTKDKLKVADFPNTFLCIIPFEECEDCAKECENKVKEKWREISERVRKIIMDDMSIEINQNLWNDQIEKMMSISTIWYQFFNWDKYNEIKDELPEDLQEFQEKWLNFLERPEREAGYGHFYYLTYDILGTILVQASRFWDAWEEKPQTNKKCLMCGRRNAILEKDEKNKDKIYKYWDGNSWEVAENVNRDFANILKKRERLCAICLTKRLYGKVFRDIFNSVPPKFESVVDIAAKDFIKQASLNPSLKEMIKEDVELVYKHEWKSTDKEDLRTKYEKCKPELKNLWKTNGKPNKYYAILCIDGDLIGKLLSGEKIPQFGEFLHPVFKNRIMKWEKGENLINLKRILSPSYHIAISRAMKNFSIYKVPEIVEEEYNGFLVYSGGDDVLALFSANKVVEAANELQDIFRKDFYKVKINGEKKEVMGFGESSSMSAGIVFAHYNYPLYDVIEKVREAEKKAKNDYGRNAFCLIFIKSSGEILKAGGKWEFIKGFKPILDMLINKKVSHRFIYDFMQILKVLSGEPLKADIKRLLKRRKTDKASDEEINKMYGNIIYLIDKYEIISQSNENLSLENIGIILKILYDGYRGEK